MVPDTRVVPSMGEPQRFSAGQHESYQVALDAAVASVSDRGLHDGASGHLLDGPVVEALVEIGPDETDLLVCGSRGYGPSPGSCWAVCPVGWSGTPGSPPSS